MKTYIVGLSILFCLGVVSLSHATGIGYSSGTTSSSTPVIVATPYTSTASVDLDMMITNPSATPGAVIVTSGTITVAGTPVPVTICNHTIAANEGGFISSGWRYPAPAANNTVKITDVNNVGLEYDFKFWNAIYRTNRPQ